MKRTILILMVCTMILSGCGAADSRKTTQTSESSGSGSKIPDEDGEEGLEMLGVPLSSLKPFEEPGKAAIKEQLGVTVPREAQITYSEFDQSAQTLHFTWTIGEGNKEYTENTDYYSVSFEKADLKKGSGNILYVRSQGADALKLTQALADSAFSKLSSMLKVSVPEEYRIVSDISSYAGVRSVLFSWEPRKTVDVDEKKYHAGYEFVEADYTGGTLVYLESVMGAGEASGESGTEKGKYTEEEIKEMKKSAEAFLSSNQFQTSGYVKYDVEHPLDKGNVLFYYRYQDEKYQTMIVYVNAKNNIVGFALSPGSLS